MMALGNELREALRGGGDRIGPRDTQNVEAFAAGVRGKFGLDGSAI
jgi:hypothetical protein